MKKVLKTILLVSATSILMACGSQSSLSSLKSAASPSSLTVNSSSGKASSIYRSSNSSRPLTSSNDPNNDNQLSTQSGLVVKFNAKGARIDKITFAGKQIAKDGFTVGRCANRIAKGKCTIDGVAYNLTINNNGNHLHGGGSSWQGPFANANWTKVSETDTTITYTIHSKDGEEGYPGNMDMTVKYTLLESGELSIEYIASTDKTTLCNPTNHLFMALNGDTSYSNLKLWIDADNYTPLANSLPTGEIASVAGTQFDFRTEKTFDGSKNYDDNLVLNGSGYRKVATMTGKKLGVKVDVFTDRPGLQLYKDGSGNICLETQMFPDAINQTNFEDPLLEPGVNFYSKTSYVFTKVS